MPIVFEFEDLSGQYKLGVWHSTESLDELYPFSGLRQEEQALFQTFTSATRQREFLTVRRLLRELCGSAHPIHYDPKGRPTLGGNGFISISHTGQLVAIILSATHEVGIDIENRRDNIVKVAPKFISPEEYEAFGDALSNDAMHLIWGAKEVMFKVYGKGDVDFKKDMKVMPIIVKTEGTLEASMDKNGVQIKFEISYMQLESSFMVWTCKA